MAEVPEQLKPYVFKEGNKLGGRKKGKTLKEYAKDHLAKMTEEERVEYLNGLPRDLIWKMSEGSPHQTTEQQLDVNITVVAPSAIVKKLKDEN